MVWLARFTSSGINDVLDMDVDSFFMYFDAAIKVFESEINTPSVVLIKGYLNPD